MRVRIGNRIYNSNDEPIMIIFDIGEKGLVEDMRPQDMKFCVYPNGSDAKHIEYFMRGEFPKLGYIGGIVYDISPSKKICENCRYWKFVSENENGEREGLCTAANDKKIAHDRYWYSIPLRPKSNFGCVEFKLKAEIE